MISTRSYNGNSVLNNNDRETKPYSTSRTAESACVRMGMAAGCNEGGGGNSNFFHISGGTCYKYRWGSYDVGSSNVYFGGNISSEKVGSSYIINSAQPCSFVCSFNETGNNNPTTRTDMASNLTYTNSQMYIVFGRATLTTSMFFVQVQTSKLCIT